MRLLILGPIGSLIKVKKTSKMTLPQQERMRAQLEAEHGPEQTEVVHTWPDGWTVRHLPNWNEVAREGKMMHHCWGGLGGPTDLDPIYRPDSDDILYSGMNMSLRDPNNWPHASFTYDPRTKRAAEVGGHGGQYITDADTDEQIAHLDRVIEFVRAQKEGGSLPPHLEPQEIRESKIAMAITPEMLNEWAAQNPYAYHKTSPLAVEQIEQEGIKPSPWNEEYDYPEREGMGGSAPGHVYLFTPRHDSFEGAGNPYAQFRIPLAQLDPSKFHFDADYADHLMEDKDLEQLPEGAVYDIHKYVNKPDSPYNEPENVQHSMKMGSIAYRGEIPPHVVERNPEYWENPKMLAKHEEAIRRDQEQKEQYRKLDERYRAEQAAISNEIVGEHHEGGKHYVWTQDGRPYVIDTEGNEPIYVYQDRVPETVGKKMSDQGIEHERIRQLRERLDMPPWNKPSSWKIAMPADPQWFNQRYGLPDDPYGSAARLYHGTPIHNLHKIMREGLVPWNHHGYSPWEEDDPWLIPRPDHVYLAESPSTAVKAVTNVSNNVDPILFHVNPAHLDPALVNPDEDAFLNGMHPIYEDPQPKNTGEIAEKLKFGDDPDQTAEGIEKYHTLAYRGAIPPEALTPYYRAVDMSWQPLPKEYWQAKNVDDLEPLYSKFSGGWLFDPEGKRPDAFNPREHPPTTLPATCPGFGGWPCGEPVDYHVDDPREFGTVLCPNCQREQWQEIDPIKQEHAEHPDPWMDNEPGSLTLPDHWAMAEEAFYHAAPTEDRARIQTHGLIPSQPGLHEQWSGESESARQELAKQPVGVYLAPQPEYTMGGGKHKDIWRIDPKYVRDPQQDHIFNEVTIAPHPIPPEALSLHIPAESSQMGQILFPGMQDTRPESWMWNRPYYEQNKDRWQIGQPTSKTADYSGWTNWDTWHTKLMMDNERELYEAQQKMAEEGWTPEQIRDWVLQHVIGPHNARQIADAKEWNEIPEHDRLDPRYEEFREKTPEGADFVDALGFGKDVSDVDPTLIDPELVNWDEIHHNIQSERNEDREYEQEDDRLRQEGLTFHMPGHSDETNQMLDAWLKHHGVTEENQKTPQGSSAEHWTRMQVPIEHLPMDEGEYTPEQYAQWQEQGVGEPRVRSFGWNTLHDIQNGRANPWQTQRMNEALTGQGYTPEQVQQIMRQKWRWEGDERTDLDPRQPQKYVEPDDEPGDLTIPQEWTSSKKLSVAHLLQGSAREKALRPSKRALAAWKLAHRLNWEPGTAGKGLVHNGEVHTWTVKDMPGFVRGDGTPTHAEYALNQLGMGEEGFVQDPSWKSAFIINHDGKARSYEADEPTRQFIENADPRLTMEPPRKPEAWIEDNTQPMPTEPSNQDRVQISNDEPGVATIDA